MNGKLHIWLRPQVILFLDSSNVFHLFQNVEEFLFKEYIRVQEVADMQNF